MQQRKQIQAALLTICIAVCLVFALGQHTGSHLPGKDHTVVLQISAINEYAYYYQNDLMKLDKVNNYEFVRKTGLTGSFFKFKNGEVLDPWDKPFLINRKDGQIIVISPGFEEYKKLPWYNHIFQ